MKAAIQTLKPHTESARLHRCHMIVDGNSHRSDLCLTTLPEGEQNTLISEALLPQIRTTATLIAAMRHDFNQASPAVFTEEADWFAARIIVLGARRFHLDITLMPMLHTANRRAEAFARQHQLPFAPAEMRMSLHAGRPANLLIIETAHETGCDGIVANSLSLARRLPQII